MDWLAVSRWRWTGRARRYTVDTLRELRARSPEDEYVFVLGADQARALGSWREPERVLELARLAVAERAGVPARGVARAVAGVGGEGA